MWVYFIGAITIKCELNLSMRHLTPQGVWEACLAACYSENEIFPVNYASSSGCLDTSRDSQSVSDADMDPSLPHTHTYLNTVYTDTHETMKFATQTQWLTQNLMQKTHRPQCCVMSCMELMIQCCSSVPPTEEKCTIKYCILYIYSTQHANSPLNRTMARAPEPPNFFFFGGGRR